MSVPSYIATANFIAALLDILGKYFGSWKHNKLSLPISQFLAFMFGIYFVYLYFTKAYTGFYSEENCYMQFVGTGMMIFATGGSISYYMTISAPMGEKAGYLEETGLLMNYSLVFGIGFGNIISIFISKL